MIKFFHDFRFADCILYLIIAYQKLFLHTLHRIVFARVAFYCSKHFSEWTFTKQLSDFKVLELYRRLLWLSFLGNTLISWNNRLCSTLPSLFISKRHFFHTPFDQVELPSLFIRLFQFFYFFILTLYIVCLSLLKSKIRNFITFAAAVVLAKLLNFIKFEYKMFVD